MTTTANFYDYIMPGYLGDLNTAKETCLGLDWMEIEKTENSYPYLNYMDTVNGVEIYYNYGSDDFYFAEAKQ